MLTPGSLGPCPPHQVGLCNRRLRAIHFPMKPPDTHSVVIRTWHNLPKKQSGDYIYLFLKPTQLSPAPWQGNAEALMGFAKKRKEDYHSYESLHSLQKNLNLQYKKARVGCCLTFVKSDGHHTTEVTSSLWPWSVMGGCLGWEIYNRKIRLKF